MAAAAASGLRGFRLVEAEHFVVRLIDQLVDQPGVQLPVLAEAGTDQKAAVLGAREDVHIALIALIDPFEGIRRLSAYRAGELTQALIREGGRSMTDISYAVGINDPHYFSKIFKKEFGMTPSEFKQQTPDQ